MAWHEMTELVQDAALAAFGEEELFDYEPFGAALVPDVEGIWRDAHLEAVNEVLEEEVSTSSPSLGVKLAHLPQAPTSQADYVTRKRTGQRYLVVDDQPDGEGWVRLVLHEAVA